MNVLPQASSHEATLVFCRFWLDDDESRKQSDFLFSHLIFGQEALLHHNIGIFDAIFFHFFFFFLKLSNGVEALVCFSESNFGVIGRVLGNCSTNGLGFI
jgi:hypothetical protein